MVFAVADGAWILLHGVVPCVALSDRGALIDRQPFTEE